jgi:di/tricarboxylate transporter
VVTVALWIFGGSIGVNAVAAAIVGLTILLVTGVTSWKVGRCGLGSTQAQQCSQAQQCKEHAMRSMFRRGAWPTANRPLVEGRAAE